MKRMRFICCLLSMLAALFMAMPATVSAANGDDGNWTVSSPEELQAAIDAANEGTKETNVTLGGSFTVTGPINVEADASKITIDLNGFTLTVSAGLTNSGNLTITAKDPTSGTFDGVITNKGEMTIKGGNFCAGKDGEDELIDNTDGTLTITGGEFKGKFYEAQKGTAMISGGRYSNKDVLSWLSAGNYTLMCLKDHYTVIEADDAVARQMCGAKYISGDGIYYRYYEEAQKDAQGAKLTCIGYYVDFNYLDASGQLDDDKWQEVIVGVGKSVNEALEESEKVLETPKYKQYIEWGQKRTAAIRKPALAGYSFKGWYEVLDYEWTDNKLVIHQYADTAFDLGTPVTEEMVDKDDYGDYGITLVSKWEKPLAAGGDDNNNNENSNGSQTAGTGSSSGNDGNGSQTADGTPETGDDFNLVPPIVLMLLAAAAGTGAIALRRKNG